jgi:hypothetical protein
MCVLKCMCDINRRHITGKSEYLKIWENKKIWYINVFLNLVLINSIKVMSVIRFF